MTRDGCDTKSPEILSNERQIMFRDVKEMWVKQDGKEERAVQISEAKTQEETSSVSGEDLRSGVSDGMRASSQRDPGMKEGGG